jgi:very-short-patch-repair endonuclease
MKKPIISSPFRERTKVRGFARFLRKNQTDAENLLWSKLRSRQLENAKFRRQAPIGKYIVDFLCLEKRMIIEIDGGQHNESSEAEKDKNRTRQLERKGYRVLRFWNNEVLENLDGVLEKISIELNPHPNLLPKGEGKVYE